MKPTEQMIEAGARALGESRVAISFDGLPAAIQRVARDEAHTVLSAASAAVPEPVRVRVRVDPNRYGMYDLINGQGERMDAAGLMLALIPISPVEDTP